MSHTATYTRKILLLILLFVGVREWAFSQDARTAINTGSAPGAGPRIVSIPEPAASSVEHWDKPSLKDNDLHPDPPLAGQTDTFPEFTRELVRVQWRTGDPIDLYIVRPAGVVNPPVILYLYGYPTEAVRFLDPAFCKTVTKKGFAAVGFSSRLTGQRYHDVPMKTWFVSELQHSLVGTAHDVQMILTYLQERGGFDISRIGVFGEGSGGTVALLTASVDSRIKAVDVLDPWGDWPSWVAGSRMIPDGERASYLKPDFLQSVAALDPVSVLPGLSHTPLRVQQSLWNSSKTPASARERIAAALPPSAVLARYNDEHQYFEAVGHDGKMLDWIQSTLVHNSPSN